MNGTSNPKIRTVDIPILDKVFGMEDGYVLDFSNRTFAEFFQEELRVDVYHPRWAVDGESKAKRLRYFLRHANRKTVLDTLNALWEYREVSSVTHDYPELDDKVRVAFFRIIERLGGHVAKHVRGPIAIRHSQKYHKWMQQSLRILRIACCNCPNWSRNLAAMHSKSS